MKRIGLLVACLVGCGGAGARATSAPSAYRETAAAPMSPATVGARPEAPAAAPAVTPDGAPTPSPIAVTVPERRLPQSGQLTAGVWDDNLNFDFWHPYATNFGERGDDFRMFSKAEMDQARRALSLGAPPKTALDVQLVLDTTGSMGDELSYLQSELDAIAARVKTAFPGVTPRWSLVLYRDHGDAYVTRPFDFTTDTDRFRANLRAQEAAGGGDTPEAVVEGLEKGLAQSWTPGAAAKIAFWVADAPAHPGEGPKLANVIKTAQAKGVHIYPIASSDVDDAAEFQMRSAAQLTGGRYVFLTNDSGIGHAHAEPHIPCYSVTRLDHAMVRIITAEMTGKRPEIAPAELVRNVGQPDKTGVCKLSSGMLVASY